MELNKPSEAQLDLFDILERICSVMSLLGCIFIIVTFCVSRSFHKPINRLVFYASLYVPLSHFLLWYSTPILLGPLILTQICANTPPPAQWKYDDKCGDTYGEDICAYSLGRWMSVPGLPNSDVGYPWDYSSRNN